VRIYVSVCRYFVTYVYWILALVQWWYEWADMMTKKSFCVWLYV